MKALNKHAALRKELSNPAIGSKDHLRKLALSLLDEVERANTETDKANSLIDEIRAERNFLQKLAGERQIELEAAEKRIAEHNFENRLLANADRDIKALRQRIAELEARTITLPQRLQPGADGYDDWYVHSADDGEYLKVDDVIAAIRAAGIGVKGERLGGACE